MAHFHYLLDAIDRLKHFYKFLPKLILISYKPETAAFFKTMHSFEPVRYKILHPRQVALEK